jgi:hypothetical protein
MHPAPEVPPCRGRVGRSAGACVPWCLLMAVLFSRASAYAPSSRALHFAHGARSWQVCLYVLEHECGEGLLVATPAGHLRRSLLAPRCPFIYCLLG